MNDQTTLWGYALTFWDKFGLSLMIVGAVLAGIAVIVSLSSSFILYRVSEIAQSDLQEKTKALEAKTAQAVRETASLQLQLEQERQKRIQRWLTEEQRSALVGELRGKISAITLVYQNDLETRSYALASIGPALQDAGVQLNLAFPPPEDKWFTPAGLMIHKPGDQNDLEQDPLYKALKKAGLYGGNTAEPLVSAEPLRLLPGVPRLPDGYILYVGQKNPFE